MLRKANSKSAPTLALQWIQSNHLKSGGIRVESGHRNAYPEVSGYLVPTLLNCGEVEPATKITRWLMCIQRSDGSYTDPDKGHSHIFDTGQVLRGLLAAGIADLMPGVEASARRAADYLLSQMQQEGKSGFPCAYKGTICPETVQLYVLPPLAEASRVLHDQRYSEAAERCLEYYIQHSDFLRIDDLTNFLAYQLEALIDLGRQDLAQSILDNLRTEQRADGSVRGIGNAKWVCTPGLAQLAICWYKINQWGPADNALAWLEKHQEPNGGFRGSYGPKAAYKPGIEISWAPKFYLDAHFLRIASFFQRHADDFPTSIPLTDGRLQVLLEHINNGDNVLEVGCGKGRFLAAIKAAFSNVACAGVDPSPALKMCLPEGIVGVHGTLESIPLPDNSFDVAFSVEALEHSINHKRAVEELVRVTKPGGWVVIIDKQQKHWGRLSCPSWERWPEINTLKSLLYRSCDQVAAESVAYENNPTSDGLMVAWYGRKRSRLSEAQWNQVLISDTLERNVVEAVRYNRFSAWGIEVLCQTEFGRKVVEIGCGTGQISLQLSQAGRIVTCLDNSQENLDFVLRCASQLGIKVDSVCADATGKLPFFDGQFDCLWSSGLLEHFSSVERQAMLKEWARVCSGKVINLVPNAACVAYRMGKMKQERRGVWPYGLEMPILSLRSDYEAAGIKVVEEFTVDAFHALNFLSSELPEISLKFSEVLRALTDKELADWHQGYLLMTVGQVDSGRVSIRRNCQK